MQLLPGCGDEPIKCTLEKVSLNDELDYEALSYSWSRTEVPEELPTSPFRVNDTVIHTLPNLSHALHHLREPDRPRKLWIDYVCINQYDTKERNAQVQLMGDIYQRAWRVVCWLGQADAETPAAMKLLSDIASDAKHLGECFVGDDAESIARKSDALEGLLNRPWFFRIWTVQEVALAKAGILVCGDQTLPWQVIRAAEARLNQHWNCCIYFIQAHPSFGVLNTSINQASSRSFGETGGYCNLSMYELLTRFMGYRATDARDHIYGMVGMLDPAERSTKVDYNLPVAAVFRRMAVDIMRRESTIEYLVSMFYSEAHPEAMSTLPSWVADFSHLTRNYLVPRTARLYNACGAKSQTQFRVIDEETVAYDGVFVDTVAVVDEEFDLEWGIMSVADAQALFNQLQHIEQMVEARKESFGYPDESIPAAESADPSHARPRAPSPAIRPTAGDISTTPPAPPPPSSPKPSHPHPSPSTSTYAPPSPPATLFRALYRTLCFGGVADAPSSSRRLHAADGATYAAARHALATYAAAPPDTPATAFYAALAAADVFPFAQCFTVIMCAMRFFITRGGRMGVGPKDTRAGDRVVVLKGGRVPFVLRTRGERASWTEKRSVHAFLGPAYVEGVMDGEAVRDVGEARWRRRIGGRADGDGDGDGESHREWTEICLV